MRPTELDRDLASRPPSVRRGARALLPLLALLGACVAPPREARDDRVDQAWIDTVPSGARCITSDGEVYVTPASIPVRGTAFVELELEGHAPRKVELCPGPARPRAATLVFGEFFHLLDGECWERVEMEHGRAVVVLERLEPARPAPARWVDPDE